jgi:hypothetical protein
LIRPDRGATSRGTSALPLILEAIYLLKIHSGFASLIMERCRHTTKSMQDSKDAALAAAGPPPVFFCPEVRIAAWLIAAGWN